LTSNVDTPIESGPLTGAKGQKVGAYTLIELIGGGGMGEVWLARHELLGRLAAVKLIRPEGSLAVSGAEEARRRFEREARATSALRSPHTIAVYDFGFTDRRTFYYAMELLEGFPLDVLVEKFGEIPPARVIHLLRGACESLTEAHERGMIHRDIKPANIFTCSMGMARDFVKVLDFGLVKQVVKDGTTSLTAEGAIPGSPAFLPPEAAKGDMTAKADVYALACVAYWLLTGNYVFNGVTALEMMVGHVHMQPQPPSERTHQKIPTSLEQLVLDCLKKNPEERPTMKSVGERLAACAAEHPWSAAEAEAWWTAHQDALPPRHAADVATPTWTDAERSARVKEGVDRLQRHFDLSHFDVGELDRRLLLVKKADDAAAITALFADLPRLDAPPPAAVSLPPPSSTAAQVVVAAPSTELVMSDQPVVSVMSSFVRRFDLRPGTLVKAVSVMGSAVLDFRGAVGGPGIVEARCVSVMGSIEIIVPPDIHVEIVSTGFWGSVEQIHTDAPLNPDKPTLRITGVVVMGSIEVTTTPNEYHHHHHWRGRPQLPEGGRGDRRRRD
jgi:serine/threonine protein kinase